ncbi:MAG: citrate/2-methylcitrate synthase [Clostridiales bacterium]|nr:citrate/2-methylcitrate synthase [Clostridiales bacterium]
MDDRYLIAEYAQQKTPLCNACNQVQPALYQEYGVQRGLRDENGKGVLTGLTNISEISAFRTVDGKKTPSDGRLRYRGYDVKDLVNGSRGQRFVFEEGAYLLLFGKLPTQQELEGFHEVLAYGMDMPTNFTRDVIMKAPSKDIMNSMTRSVLTLASYDDQANDLEQSNVLRQCLQLISIFPMLAVYGYHAYNHYNKNGSMYIHRPDPELSIAENILRMLRPNMSYTPLEANVLDIALLLHMEHGGGNNSTFTTRVVTSSGSDTYSTMAAALCSLKGKKHGGANIMVMQMMEDIREHISDYQDEDEIKSYLNKILSGDAFDHQGLIYGMGHAVYSLSDPREVILKSFVEKLAVEKDRQADLALYTNVEHIGTKLIAEKRKIYKGVSPNVDFYSGFVYDMLGIPMELYTPLFAIARVVGWSAHRMEELSSATKIIRPAYQSLVKGKTYYPRDER